MHRKCHTCLCRICLTVCGKCVECKEEITYCEDYNGFEQMSIFNIPQEPQYQGTPRHSLAYYGLTDERVEELEKLIRSGRYASLASQAAHTANEMIAEYLIKSIVENKSYDKLEFDDKLGRICYGRTDFYGCRRYFIACFDKEMRRIGK